MVNGDSSAVLRHVRALFGAGAAGGMSDGQLLERFRRRRGDPDAEAAFAVLVARHGPMVFGVCRRALGDPNDAADAFQATFLLLVRKAGTVRVDDSLGRWLYGVSRRVAAKAKAARTRRAACEGRELGLEPAGPESADEAERRELLAALDEEVSRLPEPFRAAVVLCDLGGLPQDAAAQQFGCPVGTVESRLSRGRKRLRERLSRRGLAPMLAGPPGLAPPVVPEALSLGTVKAATHVASVSAAVSTLIERVITDMAWTTIKTLALGLGAVTVACGLGITAADRLKAADNPLESQARLAVAPEKPPDAVAIPLRPGDGDWVGQHVITRLGTVLKVGPRVVDDQTSEMTWRSGQRYVRVYRVERVSGPWLWLAPLEPGVKGWVPVAQVVPFDQAIDYFTSVIRANPKSGSAYFLRGCLWGERGAYDNVIADDTEAIRLDPKDPQAYEYRGYAWDAKGEYDKAIADYTEAIRLDPRWSGAYGNRGNAWRAKGVIDKAIADYDEAIRLAPEESFAYGDRGNAWQDKGEYDKSIADYTEAIRLDPKDAAEYHNRGSAWRGKGEYDKAIADYNEAIRLDPKRGAGFTGRAMAFQAKDEYDKAIADYDAAIRLDPHQALAYSGRGSVLQHDGEFDKAIADFNEAIRLDPKDGETYYERGQAWQANGELDKAIADFDAVIRLLPEKANAYFYRGNAWITKNEYDKAVADFTEAIRLEGDGLAYESRGTVLLMMKQYDKAIADLTEAIRIDPDTHAYDKRGLAWSGKREYDKAIADCTEAIRLEPGNTPVHYLRASAWSGKGEYDKAIADCTEAIRIDPKDAHAYVGRAQVWSDQKEYDKAIADFTEAIRIDPKDAPVYLCRGNAWSKKREYDKAIADFTKAITDFTETIRIDPKNAPYINRGLAWSEKREYAKAIADFTEAIRVDPKDAWAYNYCAWIWATCPDAKHRDGKRAVESATQACALTDGKDADKLGTLAAAYAESGDFDAAVKWQEKVMGLYKDEENLKEARARLALYQAKKTYRQDPGTK